MPSTPLPLRIVIASPPAGVLYCLQRMTRSDCVGHVRSDGGDAVFELEIEVKEGGELPDFRGPFVLGKRGDRYVSALIGTLAGDANSCWTRATKFKLDSITWTLIEAVRAHPGAVLVGRFVGTAARGFGPACATLRFVDEGWRVE